MIVSNRVNHSLFRDPLFCLQSPSCARDKKYLLTVSARRCFRKEKYKKIKQRLCTVYVNHRLFEIPETYWTSKTCALDVSTQKD